MGMERVFGLGCLSVTGVVSIVYRVFIFFICKFAFISLRRAP
jgi:hypothetical protein